MKVLVTGGAGFVGHHLVRRLLARGDRVSVIDDFSTGLRSRLDPYADDLELTVGSVLDPAALDRAAAGCEAILHEAAIASVARSLEEPALTDQVNAGGTIEVVLAAARAGVRRVVLAGSSSVYGVPKEMPCRESQIPDPASPYGVSKLAAEHYLHTLGRHHGVETVVLRYFNVFGPGQDPASEYAAVVPRFVTAVLDGQRPVINGSGEITRDYVYADDVVDANLAACRPETPSGLTCNVASGRSRSLLELLDAICAETGRRVDPVVGPPRPGDIAHSWADISLARQALGFDIAVPLEEGIARTVAWYREQPRVSA